MFRRSLMRAAAASSLLSAFPRPSCADGPDTLTFSWFANAGPLHPHLYSPNQMYAQAMLYEPLVRYGENGRILPGLAVAWSQSDDGESWIFRLRPGVRFHDGTPFDAAAAVTNIDAILANRERHAWLGLIARIVEAEALDAGTMRLRLDGPYYPTLMELALIRPVRFVSPAALRPDRGISAPIGTGPWRLAESVRGERDVFVRNDEYWGKPPSLKRVVVRVVPDATTRALALEAGEIDMIYGADQLDADTYLRFTQDARVRTARSGPLATRYLALNSARFPTSDIAVRYAIAHAIDRDALVRHILLDTEPAASALLAPNVPYADLGLRAPAFDPAEAAALLEAAGWSAKAGSVRAKAGQSLALDLCFVGTDALQRMLAQAIQADLARIGVDARLIGEDTATVYGRQKSGEFGMILGESWGAPYDPHAFLSSMRSASHADYQAQSGLPMKAEIDRRIGTVLGMTDPTDRREEYRWLLTTLHEQAVYVPLSYLTNKVVERSGWADIPFGATRYEIPFDRIGGA